MSSINRNWFVPGDGIAREVITADIQRYLGPDATVRPGQGTDEYQGADGFWITAYRTLTSQMIQDLKSDSSRWRAESQGRVNYQDSQTHQSRQYYGPTTPAPSSYAQQPAAAAQYQQSYSYTHQQPARGYPPQQSSYVATPGYGQEQRTTPNYTYAQPTAPGHAEYYAQQQQDPRYAYHQPHAPHVAPRQPDVYAQPSTTSPQYTYADGRAYQQSQPPRPNEGRRR